MANVSEPGYRKRIGYQAALLGGFATLSAAFLAIGDNSTRDAIAQRLDEDVQASLGQVIPDDMHDNNLLENTLTLDDKGRSIYIYRAIKGDKTAAVAFNVIGKGYAGDIALIMGVNANGELLGVRVLSHMETPGLGDKIEEKKSEWVFSFNGLSLENVPESYWAVKKDGGRFDSFSGATITPRAVVKAVKEGLMLFKAHQQEILENRMKEQGNSTSKPATKMDASNGN
jgi:electron transport complex protein RnfG